MFSTIRSQIRGVFKILFLIVLATYFIFDEFLIFEFPENTSIYIWDNQSLNTNSLDSESFEILQKDGIENIYLNIDSYIDILEIKSENEREIRLSIFVSNIINYLDLAKKNGIKVYLCVGGSELGVYSNRTISKSILDFVNEFNTKYQGFYLIEGLLFNIKPYEQDYFDINANKILVDYLDTINFLIKEHSNSYMQFRLGFTTQYWLGDSDNRFEWGYKYLSLNQHLFEIVSNINAGFIVIFNYTNYLYGENGLISNVSDQLAYASDYKNINIIVGIETDESKSTNESFYNGDLNNLKRNLFKLDNYLSDYPVYKGLAIHSTNGYFRLN